MKLLLIATALFTATTLMSCNDDDDDLRLSDVPQTALQAFNKMYPGTTAVWEWDRGLLNADFRSGGIETDVWFQKDGTWVRTETDWVKPLPDAIQSYINANYQGYMLDDADWVETPTQKYFDIELEARGKADVHLKMLEDGKLL